MLISNFTDEHTRVVLPDSEWDPLSSYINANYIRVCILVCKLYQGMYFGMQIISGYVFWYANYIRVCFGMQIISGYVFQYANYIRVWILTVNFNEIFFQWKKTSFLCPLIDRLGHNVLPVTVCLSVCQTVCLKLNVKSYHFPVTPKLSKNNRFVGAWCFTNITCLASILKPS